jgi:hypothetical protein
MSVPKSFHETFDSTSTLLLYLQQFFGYCGSKSAVEVMFFHHHLKDAGGVVRSPETSRVANVYFVMMQNGYKPLTAVS